MATYRVNIGLDYPGTGGPGINAWHFRATDAVTGPDVMLQRLADFYQYVRFIFPIGMTVTCPNEIIEDPYGSPQYRSATGWQVVGAGTGGSAPQLLAIVVSWRTLSATRSGRGRTFVGPLAYSAMQADGTPSSDAVGVCREASTTLADAQNVDDGAAFGIYSRTDSVLRDINSARVLDRFAFLSSRRD